MKLKICGNHSLQDTTLAVESKANYIGFVFAASKRQVKPSEVCNWLKQTPRKQDQRIVGVFVNPTFAEIAAIVGRLPLDIIQLHGDEPPEQVAMIKNMLTVSVWKTIHHEESAWDKMDAYKALVDAFLIDNKSATAWGGTGQAFDWALVPKYVLKAHALEKPCFIAGGITPDNASDLLRYQPDGIDLASGVETNRQKDKRKIILLQERIEQYERHFA